MITCKEGRVRYDSPYFFHMDIYDMTAINHPIIARTTQHSFMLPNSKSSLYQPIFL